MAAFTVPYRPKIGPMRTGLRRRTLLVRGLGAATLSAGTRPLRADAATPVPIPARSRHVGINLAGIAYWTTQFPFADMTKISPGWQPGSAPGADPAPLAVAKEGHPLRLEPGQHAGIVVAWNNVGFPKGPYTVIWEGDGALGFASSRVKVLSTARQRIVVEATDTMHRMGVQIDRTNPADPVRNVRFLWPGTEATHAVQRFNPEFLERIAPFSALRFVDWGLTNGSPIVEWADRPRLQDATWAPKGVPLEAMIDLANTLLADPWFCVPHRASDDYVRRMATLVRDRLDPRLRAHIEYSNEVWNLAFPQGQWAAAESARLGLPHPHGMGSAFHARRSLEIFLIFGEVYGAQALPRLVRVVAGQAVWTQFLENALRHPDLVSHTDALAIAPYFSAGTAGDPKHARQSLAMSNEELFAQMRATIATDVKRAIDINLALARQHRLPLLAYEAGSHDTASQFDGAATQEAMTALFSRAHRDPRMRDVYDAYWALWIRSGGDTMMQYQDIGPWSKWGLWGALESVMQDPATAPKYRALLDVIARHPCPKAGSPCR